MAIVECRTFLIGTISENQRTLKSLVVHGNVARLARSPGEDYSFEIDVGASVEPQIDVEVFHVSTNPSTYDLCNVRAHRKGDVGEDMAKIVVQFSAALLEYGRLRASAVALGVPGAPQWERDPGGEFYSAQIDTENAVQPDHEIIITPGNANDHSPVASVWVKTAEAGSFTLACRGARPKRVTWLQFKPMMDANIIHRLGFICWCRQSARGE